VGATKRPAYRVVAIEGRKPRDGRSLEILGFYDPLTDPATVKIEADRVRDWIGKGAQPSDTVVRLLRQVGLDAKGQVSEEPPKPRTRKAPVKAARPAAARAKTAARTKAATAVAEPAETAAEPAEAPASALPVDEPESASEEVAPEAAADTAPEAEANAAAEATPEAATDDEASA
jgi:small subunit ribosomal protein S16